jgi:hypothetical protein
LSYPLNSALGAAIALVLGVATVGSASAHAVCGSRIFPATLGIDDPGVGDEVALPTVTYLPTNSGWQNEADISYNYTKTILPNFGISVGQGATFLNPQGWGRSDLTTEEKWNFLCIPEAEFMASVGFGQDWGKTYTNGMGNDYNTLSPIVDVGLGFGALPHSLNLLRPLAVTFEASEDFPDQRFTAGNQNPYNFNWGFTIQYSLPYLNANVAQIDNAFLKRLIPLTEFTFSRPVANFDTLGPAVTTGTVQPGVIYEGDGWQVAVEAVLPINSASGHGVGVVGELHFYLDDLMPNTLGKPIFGANK